MLVLNPPTPTERTSVTNEGIIATGVTMTFSRNGMSFPVLRDVDIDIPAGGFVSLLGPSGCGKSTLLRILAGIQPPTTGTISIGGRSVTDAVRGGSLGLVQQKAALLPWKTALQNAAFLVEQSGRGTRREAESRAANALELVGLAGAHGKYPHELSGGMAQRVSIARALALDPEVLFMDEPFGALDAITRDQLNQSLQDIWQETGKTVVFVTHSISEAVFLSDTVHVMAIDPGRISDTVRIDLPRPRGGESTTTAEFVHNEATLRAALDRNVEAARSAA